jgi:Mor family transcriptional regulator
VNTGPSAELVQAMYAYYQQGYSLVDVGQRFHYTDSAVMYIFRRYGLPTRKPRQSHQIRVEAETRQMYADYETGLSLEDVGRKYGYAETTVWHRFKRMNLPRRPQGQPSWKKA